MTCKYKQSLLEYTEIRKCCTLLYKVKLLYSLWRFQLSSFHANTLYFFFMLKNIFEYGGKYENTRCCITEIFYLKLLCRFKHCTHCTVCVLKNSVYSDCTRLF